MQVDRFMSRSRVYLLSEGGTHEETLHSQSSIKVRTRDMGTKSQPDELWICKTDTVIV